MQNLTISSISDFPAGEYGRVEVSGVGKCLGAFSAQDLEVCGILKCMDALRSDRAEVTGTLKCAGRLDAGEMEIDGAVKVEGSAGVEQLEVNGVLTVDGETLECGSAEVDGSLKVAGAFSTRELEVDGAVHVKGERLECETLECSGIVSVSGQLSGDEIHVEGLVTAQEIVGDRVFIHSKPSIGHRLITLAIGSASIRVGGPRGENPGSSAQLIEATTVDLSYVTARAVNGTHVTIGPGCVIENLDCNGTLHIHPAAQVGNVTGDYTLK